MFYLVAYETAGCNDASLRGWKMAYLWLNSCCDKIMMMIDNGRIDKTQDSPYVRNL